MILTNCGRVVREVDKVMRACAGRTIEVADFDRAASALYEMEENALKTIKAPPQSTTGLDDTELMMRFRELKGLDKAMQTQREELVNNAKLSDIDRHLYRKNGKVRETDEPEMKRHVRDTMR